MRNRKTTSRLFMLGRTSLTGFASHLDSGSSVTRHTRTERIRLRTCVAILLKFVLGCHLLLPVLIAAL
jgi:hypothetical protein